MIQSQSRNNQDTQVCNVCWKLLTCAKHSVNGWLAAVDLSMTEAATVGTRRRWTGGTHSYNIQWQWSIDEARWRHAGWVSTARPYNATGSQRVVWSQNVDDVWWPWRIRHSVLWYGCCSKVHATMRTTWERCWCEVFSVSCMRTTWERCWCEVFSVSCITDITCCRWKQHCRLANDWCHCRCAAVFTKCQRHPWSHKHCIRWNWQHEGGT